MVSLIVTPPGEYALLVTVSVSVAAPEAFEYVMVTEQVPPGATEAVQVLLLSEKLLLDP